MFALDLWLLCLDADTLWAFTQGCQHWKNVTWKFKGLTCKSDGDDGCRQVEVGGKEIEKCVSPIWTKASLYHKTGRQKRNQTAGTNVRSLKYPIQKARNYISLPKLNWITGAIPWKLWFVLLYNLVFSSDTRKHEQNILNYCAYGTLWREWWIFWR